MFRLSALALFLPLVAPGAPVPKGEKKETLYFPVVEGTKRVLEQKVGDRTVVTTETVTKVEEKDGVCTVTVSRDQGRGLLARQLFAVSDKGVSRAEAGRKEALPLLKLPAKEGDTWEGVDAGRKMTYTVGKEEEVEVPAGKFKAIRVDSVTESGPRETRSSHWHVAGVGVVKLDSTRGGATVTTVLKEFTPGKDEKKGDAKKDGPKKDK